MTKNLTSHQIKQLADRLSYGDKDDLNALIAEGQFEGFDHSDTADRFMGFADWIDYLPSVYRAAWVSNGEPTWFDATSLDDAVGQVMSGAELIN